MFEDEAGNIWEEDPETGQPIFIAKASDLEARQNPAPAAGDNFNEEAQAAYRQKDPEYLQKKIIAADKKGYNPRTAGIELKKRLKNEDTGYDANEFAYEINKIIQDSDNKISAGAAMEILYNGFREGTPNQGPRPRMFTGAGGGVTSPITSFLAGMINNYFPVKGKNSKMSFDRDWITKQLEVQKSGGGRKIQENLENTLASMRAVDEAKAAVAQAKRNYEIVARGMAGDSRGAASIANAKQQYEATKAQANAIIRAQEKQTKPRDDSQDAVEAQKTNAKAAELILKQMTNKMKTMMNSLHPSTSR